MGVLVVDDNKRCNRVGNGVPSENAARNIRVVASKISDQQHESPRRLNLLAKITERRLDVCFLSEICEGKAEPLCYPPS